MDLKKKILFIGSYAQDVYYLLEIADEASKQGFEIYFIITNPVLKLRTAALKSVSDKNYACEELIENAWSSQSLFDQVTKVKKQKEEFTIALLKRIKPSMIITTKNLFDGMFYKISGEMNIPSIYYQWTLMHSQKVLSAIKNTEAEYNRSKLSAWLKFKIIVRKAIQTKMSGVSDPWPLLAPYTYYFLISNIFRKFALEAGIDDRKIHITGNIQCDELYLGRSISAEEIRTFKVAIGLLPEDKYVIHTREDYSRLKKLTDQERVDAQRSILLAIKESAPGYKRVIKIHPKEDEKNIRVIKEIDPEAIVIDSSFSTVTAIKGSSLMISSMSTTLAHAVGMDVPTISSFLWNTIPEYKNTRYYVGLDYADTFETLKKKIYDNLFDEEYILQMNEIRKKGCEEMLMADGKSMERMIDIINKI